MCFLCCQCLQLYFECGSELLLYVLHAKHWLLDRIALTRSRRAPRISTTSTVTTRETTFGNSAASLIGSRPCCACNHHNDRPRMRAEMDEDDGKYDGDEGDGGDEGEGGNGDDDKDKLNRPRHIISGSWTCPYICLRGAL